MTGELPVTPHDGLKIAIIGGGAAGFFAALACADENAKCEITIFERSAQFLGKVRISGGGRCNVTHAQLEPRQFALHYPRGERALISPLTRFGAQETMAWFERRGVRLKTEADGRIFPVTDSSGTVIDCFLHEARMAGVKLRPRTGVREIKRNGDRFALELTTGELFGCDRLLLASGGTRNEESALLARQLGHTMLPALPSLFSFRTPTSPWPSLAGVSVADAGVHVAGTKLTARGPILITHRGLSGPAILRLSAWGARELCAREYRFKLRVDWLPASREEATAAQLETMRREHARRLMTNTPLAGLPVRVWEMLLLASEVEHETRWSNFTRAQRIRLLESLHRSDIAIDGQSLNKEEFVTCGGVSLREVNFKTMESRSVPGAFFAGELLDIDGITGGFNFQSAWTTGWIAGRAMANN